MEKDALARQIGENVCRYREERGLTQAELAEKVGVGTPFISKVERGEKMMKVQTLYNLAVALEVSCDALMHPDGVLSRQGNIHRLLDQKPEAFLEGIEQIIRACEKHFSDKQ